jgi:hypothetical protein
MAWTDAVDLYCERLGPGLTAEPLNALSNLGFMVAGLWLWRLAIRRGEPASLRALPLLMVLIGLGSASFHTVARQWAEVLDVLFIALFIYWFVACYARHAWRLPWSWALPCMALFHGFGLLVTRPFHSGDFNGSVAYFPALLGLLIFAALSAWRHGMRAGTWFFAAAGMFSLSLALRSSDLALCTDWPYGTHWAWHLLNALTLSLASLGISRSPGVLRSRW